MHVVFLKTISLSVSFFINLDLIFKTLFHILRFFFRLIYSLIII